MDRPEQSGSRLPGILYLTWKSAGQSGANAAEIYPALAARSGQFKSVTVACGAAHAPTAPGVAHLILEERGPLADIINARRIARYIKDQRIGLVHVIHRKRLIPLLGLLRMMGAWASGRSILDFRSVNLTTGLMGQLVRIGNQAASGWVDLIAGNSGTVESNLVHMPGDVERFDLGYDGAAFAGIELIRRNNPFRVWFIGTMAPANRNAAFMFSVFEQLAQRQFPFEIHVAGETGSDQADRLRAIPNVTYHGTLSRRELYGLMASGPGIGLAYMDAAHHGAAPALKLCEYAALGLSIVASGTEGLRAQTERMSLPDPVFVEQDVKAWADAIETLAARPDALQPVLWSDAGIWSYEARFERQVIPAYRALSATSETASVSR